MCAKSFRALNSLHPPPNLQPLPHERNKARAGAEIEYLTNFLLPLPTIATTHVDNGPAPHFPQFWGRASQLASSEPMPGRSLWHEGEGCLPAFGIIESRSK